MPTEQDVKFSDFIRGLPAASESDLSAGNNMPIVSASEVKKMGGENVAKSGDVGNLYSLISSFVALPKTRKGNSAIDTNGNVVDASQYNLYYFAVEAGKTYKVVGYCRSNKSSRASFFVEEPSSSGVSGALLFNSLEPVNPSLIFKTSADGYVAVSCYGSADENLGGYIAGDRIGDLENEISLKLDASKIEGETTFNSLQSLSFAFSPNGQRMRYYFVMDDKATKITISAFPNTTYRFSIQTTDSETYAQGGSGSKIYDSGWKTSSSAVIDVPSVKGKYAVLNIGFAGADAPIGEADRTAIEASTQFTAIVAGGQKFEELVLASVKRIEESLDTKQGNMLSRTTKSIVARGNSVLGGAVNPFFFKFGCDLPNYQSPVIDVDNKSIYIFAARNFVKKFDFSGKLIDTISKTLLDGEHDNDAAAIGNIIYLAGGQANNGADHSKFACKYNIATNVVTPISLASITNGSVGFRCPTACFALDSSTIVWVANDTLGNVTADYNAGFANEKLTFYKMDISTEVITQWFDVPWDSGYLQGATFVNGKIYVVSNIIKEQVGSTNERAGACLYIIDDETKTIEDKIYFLGEFEPEGLDFTIENGEVFLWTGFGGITERFLMKCKI